MRTPAGARRSVSRNSACRSSSDPAIPKHLSAFLRRHKGEAILPEGFTPDDRPARPDAILFNGGALTPQVVRDRIVDVVASWYADEDGPAFRPRVLTNTSLDLAVAHGAAYYGVVRRGGGIRIGGGTARSYYVGLDDVDLGPPLALRRPARRPGGGSRSRSSGTTSTS